MKKRIVLIIAALLVAAQAFGQAKYVFFFIGDGMGVNQVNMAEMYLKAQQNELGYGQFCFTNFPVASVATTYSASSNVTDSAASGTALATGTKTTNGHLGVDPDGNKLTSIAKIAKKNGKKVGIVTTVGVNHATPGAFYAGQKGRGMYDEIVYDLVASDFDFLAGSEFLRNAPDNRKFPDAKNIVEDAGYKVVGSVEEFQQEYASASKMVMVPDKDHKVAYAIDRIAANNDSYISLKQIVESTITFLTKDKKSNGFFIMAEGGRIDYSCHGNDAATCIQEIIDFDDAIKVAYDFYLKHPKETLILVSADHETGGLAVVPNNAKQVQLINNQKVSEDTITAALKAKMREKGREPISWDEMKDFLKEYFGFWDKVRLSPDDDLVFFDIYTQTIAKSRAGKVADEYGYHEDASIVSAAVDFLNRKAGFLFSTGGHSSGFVPVYAIGVGQEKFNAKMDNAKLPMIIKEIAKYK